MNGKRIQFFFLVILPLGENMLEKYKIVKEEKEDVLYLYLNMNYEFAQELDQQQLKQKTKNWLENQNIEFNGNKVVFVVDGIVSQVMTIETPKKRHDKELMELENGQTMTIENILFSLLLTNIKLELPLEVLKAIVVLYRSEILGLKEANQKIKRFNKNFSFISETYYKLSYPHTYKYYEQIYRQAIRETDGQYLTYKNRKIESYLHIASNGYTEAKKEIPYLTKKESFWDFTYPYYLQVKHLTVDELKKRLNLKDNHYDVKIINISQSNRIEKLQIGNKILIGDEIKVSLGLSSNDATILVEKDGLTFVTRGVGSGFGLSLWGAKALANLDCNYLQILGYYFQGVLLHE